MGHDGGQAARRRAWFHRHPDLLRTALVALAYALVTAWTFGPVLPVLSSSLPQIAHAHGMWRQIGRWDQSMVLSVVTQHADALLHHPLHPLEGGQCFPMPEAYTLGEHMIGTGLLAFVPYLVTRDPIATYNLALMLSVWIPGLTMYLLARRFVRSPAAAFVAGLLFSLSWSRLTDFGHPFVHGDLWTPLALLFLHRVVTVRGWRNAAGLTIFTALVLLESLYAVIASSIMLGSFALFLLWRQPRAFRRALPELLVAATAVIAVAFLLFEPYLRTRATWGVLSGHASVFAPAHFAFLQVSVLLALVGVADRLRGARPVGGIDPRAAIVVGGLLVYWCSIGSFDVPLLHFTMYSPVVLLRHVVPGLDAIRATGLIGLGTGLALSLLAGYGVLALTEHLRVVPRYAVICVLALYVLAERSYAPLAIWTFGEDSTMATWQARPSDEAQLLLHATTGPILRLPDPDLGTIGSLKMAADDLRLVAYDPRPTASCYNSFPSPFREQIHELAKALPDPATAEALYAIGFRTILLDVGGYLPPDLRKFAGALAKLRRSPVQLVAVAWTDRRVAYRLSSHTPFSSDPDLLKVEPGGAPRQSAGAEQPGTIVFTIVNHSKYSFRLAPIAPSDVVVRFRGADGRIAERHARVLLPLALAPGGRYQLPVAVEAPAFGDHCAVELALAARPDVVIGALDLQATTTTPASGARAHAAEPTLRPLIRPPRRYAAARRRPAAPVALVSRR